MYTGSAPAPTNTVPTFNFSNPTPVAPAPAAPFNFSMTAPVVNKPTVAPVVVNAPKKVDDDGFSGFESANKPKEHLPGLNEKEARMIDLSNLKKEDNKKK